MILSRIAGHVSKQHWTAIFIDCVIVVLCVFLGRQANDWSQARSDRREYQRALQRLEN